MATYRLTLGLSDGNTSTYPTSATSVSEDDRDNVISEIKNNRRSPEKFITSDGKTIFYDSIVSITVVEV